jgi:Zn-dependent M28 family amino/carboxypeptidase
MTKIAVQVLAMVVLFSGFGFAQKSAAPTKKTQAETRKKRVVQPPARVRRRSAKPARSSRSNRRRRARRITTPVPAGPSFDKVMSENRDLFTQGPVAEIASQQIDEPTLRAHLRYLSDDLLEGRGTGTRGGLLAARYIAAQFESLGLDPAAPGGSFLQSVALQGKTTDPASLLLFQGGKGESLDLAFGRDFVAGSDLSQPTIPVTGDLVFVGYGIHAPEQGWDDYQGIDVQGKILVMLVNEPPPSAAEPLLFEGAALTYYGRWTYKFEEAQRRGAAGVLLIHTNQSAGYGWEVVRNSWTGEQFSLATAQAEKALRLKGWIAEEPARRLLRLAGTDLDRLRQAASQRGFTPVPLTGRLATTLQTEVRRVAAPNVVALFRGSDPTLRQQVVVYTAHWDHLGIRPDQPGDNIYNGAIDNASGVAGLIALARAYAALPVRPKRSILFLATTAEEQGLLGSEFYLQSPLVPLDQTIACLNLDSLNVLGTTADVVPLGATYSTLDSLVATVAREVNLTISPDESPEQGRFFRSDHFPFVKRGIPSISLLAGQNVVGQTREWVAQQRAEIARTRYHQPGDEYSPQWDLSGLIQQVRFAFAVGLRVAREETPPQWNPGAMWSRQSSR